MEREPRADKVAVVDDVRQRFEEADAVLITEYRGLDVGQMAELRRSLDAAGTTYKIYKNSLVRRAIADSGLEGLTELLVGPTALAFVERDASAAAKALKTFAATHDALVIKGAVLSGGILDAAQVRELAELPSRQELLSQFAGDLAAPLQQLASMMSNLLGEVSGLIQALSDKGGAPGARTDAVAEEMEPAEEAAVAEASAEETEPAEDTAVETTAAESGDDAADGSDDD